MDYREALVKYTGIPFTEGNHVDILKNGDQIFRSMLAEIRKAEDTIDFLTFVYWKGDIAEKFAHVLGQKAAEGVKVRLLLDSFGALPLSKELVNHMINKGVDLVWFRPLARWKLWTADNRTHRKILICDNSVAFTGGVGIAEEWEGDARNQNEWRDTHFKITGPAISGIKSAFIENWIEAGHTVSEFDEVIDSPANLKDGVAIQTISTAATVRWSNIMLLYQSLVFLARDNIRISTAYFNPDDTLINSFKAAVTRGVDIEIILPGKHTDYVSTKIAAEARFQELLSAGIKLFYYQKTMMHAKIFTVDDELSCVGSANFNHRSMLQDDEINLVIHDKKITGILNDHFSEDLEECDEVNPHRWRNRGFLRKAQETLIYPFRSQL